MANETKKDTTGVPDISTIKDRATRSPRRVPLNKQDVLTFPAELMEKGYKYRVINDVGDRLSRAERAGYEVVKGATPLGDGRINDGTGVGSAVTKFVGNGTKGVLMRIKEEWYNEDQAEKLAAIKANEQQITTVNTGDGQYGGIRIEQSR